MLFNSYSLAIDRKTREIIGCYIGDQLEECAERNRSRKSARKLGKSIPGVYRKCAVAYTDFWEAYKTVIPNSRHRPVLK